MLTMGQRIKARRLAGKWSQASLAKLAEVSRSAVNQWEHDKHFPSTEHLVRLAEIFDCQVQDLVPEATMNGVKKPDLVDPEIRELPEAQQRVVVNMVKELIKGLKNSLKKD